MKDPYEILKVARDAEPTDIRKAYHRLAKKRHPDLNPGRDGNYWHGPVALRRPFGAQVQGRKIECRSREPSSDR
jgi:curved DNA-binding protein CbpA